MNECEMQIQLRQPPSPAQLPSPSSSTSAVAQTQPVHHNLHHQHHNHHRSNSHRLVEAAAAAERNLQNHHPQHQQHHHSSHKAGGIAASVATVQNLLESFDQRIRQTKCLNMSSDGIPSPGTSAAAPPRSSPPPSMHQQLAANPAAAAALMLLKNRIIPASLATHHPRNGIDLSPRNKPSDESPPAVAGVEQVSNKKPTNGNHIPLSNPSAGQSPSSASSGSSDCHSPPNPASNGGPGNGGSSAGGNGLNGVGKAANGGRLQFFKDGKFILELASSREQDNGRPGWVAVPRKIYWPPTAQGFTTYNGTTSTTPSSLSSSTTAALALPHSLGVNTNSNHSFQKNESSASLSFSDDNSSIQSSPWQREHCWKQLTPRKHISRELCFVYVRPRRSIELTNRGHRASMRCRRRPDRDRLMQNSRLAIRDAFQRINSSGSSSSHVGSDQVLNVDATEKDTKSAVSRMETDDVVPGDVVDKSEEKTDLDSEKKTKDKGEQEASVAEQVTEGDACMKNGSGVEKMEEDDQVDGTVKCEVKDGQETEVKSTDNSNSNDNDIDSNKTVKQEQARESVQVKLEEEDKEGKQDLVIGNTKDSLKQSSTKDTADDEADKENKDTKNGLTGRIPSAVATTAAATGHHRRVRRKRPDLEKIISNLLTNRKSILAKLKMSSPKLDALMHSHMHQHVSPRKRILREFERVSLDDVSVTGGNGNAASAGGGGASSPNSSGKRHRPRGHHQNGSGTKSGSSSSTFFVPSSGLTLAAQANGNGHHHLSSSPSSKLAASNGTRTLPPPQSLTAAPQPASCGTAPSPSAAKPISSYSIISLLGHNSSGGTNGASGGGGGGSGGSNSPRADYASSQKQQQQQQQHMESVAASRGMDLQQYNKSLPPKKKLSPPPTTTATAASVVGGGNSSNHSWPSPKAHDSPHSNHSHLMMRSPEMSPSPEHGGRAAGGVSGGGSGAFKASHYSSGGGPSANSFHPYLNVANRASPSDDRYAHHHHHRSSPQFSGSREARYSPVHNTNSSNSSSRDGGLRNPPAAHGATSPYSTSSASTGRPSAVSAASPLSSHYYPSPTGKGRRSPSPSPSPAQRRLLEDDRESELSALAMHQQMELERYAKFYGHSGMLAPGAHPPPPPPHLMMPGFEHLSEAAAAAHLMRASAGGGPGTPSAAALMNSLHQSAYLMYPPSAAAAAAAGGGVPGGPYLPPGPSNPYYNQYLAAAAAAMYGRGASPLWPYMAAGGIPGPPGSSPLRLPPTSSAGGLHHSPQMLGQRSSPVGGEGRPSVWRESSPSSPLALRTGSSERREAAASTAAVVAMDQRDDPDVPLNLSKH